MPAPNEPTINIGFMLEIVSREAADIARRHNALIDLYTNPRSPPPQMANHGTRLQALRDRVSGLRRLHLPQLRQIVDSPSSLVARSLLKIIDQYLSAIYECQRVFRHLYGDSSNQRVLQRKELELQELIRSQQDTRYQHRAEDEYRRGATRFCTGAVQLINGTDRGQVARVAEQDLFRANREVLRQKGGAFLWWRCTSCAFRLRFHIIESQHSSIRQNDETRTHPGLPLEYRSIFMAKSHLYLPYFVGLPADADKYGCVFCFGEGRALGDGTVFPTGKELATHICRHHTSPYPNPLMMEQFYVAVDGSMALVLHTSQFDLNLYS